MELVWFRQWAKHVLILEVFCFMILVCIKQKRGSCGKRWDGIELRDVGCVCRSTWQHREACLRLTLGEGGVTQQTPSERTLQEADR